MRSLARCLLLVAVSAAHAQSAPPAADLPSEAAEQIAVQFRGSSLFDVSRGVGSLDTHQRVASIERRLELAASDDDAGTEEMRVVERAGSSDLMIGDRLLHTVTEEDALDTGRTRAQLAADRLELLKSAIVRDRIDRGAQQLMSSALQSAAALAAFAITIWLLWRALRAVTVRLTAGTPRIAAALGPRAARLITPTAIVSALSGVVRLLFLLLAAICVYVCLEFVLSRFPWTRGMAEELLVAGRAALAWLGSGLLGYLPKALNLVLIVIITRYVIRLARWLFLQIERGSVTFDGFYPEWARPTYQIVRFILLTFAAVAAFPYLPGAGSEGFRGISLLLGVMVSLGAASAVANIIAGLVLTYMRPFRIGERVKIAETTGDVLSKDLFVVRVRTIKNVDVTIPNSLVLANHIINFSSNAQAHGLILHTTVTIGYDAPWRQIHELLTTAARRTEGVQAEPAPFVLQTALDDFYVRYELNAHTDRPAEMAVIYSRLHAHIQDAFNEAGVEIMSPHYVAARDGNRTAIPDDYLPKDYQPGGFTLGWARRPPQR